MQSIGVPIKCHSREGGNPNNRISFFDLQVKMKLTKYLYGSALRIVSFKKFFISLFRLPKFVDIIHHEMYHSSHYPVHALHYFVTL